jgi:hypothetical protein
MMKGVSFSLASARHRRHVPVADDQAELPGTQLLQRLLPVRRLLHILDLELLQQVADDAQHRLVVVHDQDGRVLVHACFTHVSKLKPSWRDERRCHIAAA